MSELAWTISWSLTKGIGLQDFTSEDLFVAKMSRRLLSLVGKSTTCSKPELVKRYIRVGYNLDIMRQSACLVLNPITVYSYGFLFNCTTVGQASDGSDVKL